MCDEEGSRMIADVKSLRKTGSGHLAFFENQRHSPRGEQRASTRGRAMNPSPRRRNWSEKQRRPQIGPHNARQQYERYLARAREAQVAGGGGGEGKSYHTAGPHFPVFKGTSGRGGAEYEN